MKQGLLCYLLEVWYSIRYMEDIDGCDFKEMEDNKLRCVRCGRISE